MKRSEVAALAAGLALVLAGVFVAVSLVTWDVRDPHVTPNYESGARAVRNCCGAGGAVVSSFLFRAHGAAAYAVPLALAGLGAYFLVRRSTETGLRRAAGAAVAVLALSLLAGTRADGWLASLMAHRSVEGPGGTFGAVPVAILMRFLGGVGTYLVILFALGAGSLLVSRRAVEWALAAAGRAAVSTGAKLAAFPGRLRRNCSGGRGKKDGGPQKGQKIEPAARKDLFESILAAGRSAQRTARARRPALAADDVSVASGRFGEVGKDAGTEGNRAGGQARPESETKSEKESPGLALEPADVQAHVGRAGDFDAMRPAPAAGVDGTKDAAAPGSCPDSDESEAVTRRILVPPVVGKKAFRRYELPPSDLLLEEEPGAEVDEEDVAEHGMRIVTTLAEFNIETKLVDVARGPAVTMYEFELAPGINVNRVTQLSNNIAMAVAAQDVRIIAPIPGRGTIGVEVPNPKAEIVRMRPLIEHYRSQPDRLALPLLLGRDAAGRPLVADLAKMPHLLVAGATGSGKSVCMDGIIMSLAMLRSPDQVRLLLVDPKVVELSRYCEIPHLASPVVTEMKRAAKVLDWAVRKMDGRYEMFGVTGVRDIASFNKMPPGERREFARKKGAEEPEAYGRNMPHVVIMVDELADLMMVAAKEVETSIIRLAQKSRSTGIHVVLATQRPSVDVLTGLIRANMPTRISFQVASRLESRIILDQNGAEKLLGRGDMLYMPAGISSPVRAKGVYVTDEEIASVLEHLRAQPDMEDALIVEGSADACDAEPARAITPPPTSDELYEDAVRIVLGTRRGSVSLLQRRLQIGYTRAGKLIDMMHADGLVGPARGSKAREILVTLEDWEAGRDGSALKKSA